MEQKQQQIQNQKLNQTQEIMQENTQKQNLNCDLKSDPTELEKRDVLRMSNKESNRMTRECLQTALITLMSQKPFDKITISELVRRSGVSRTAFYRNYNTKEDILNEVGDVFLDVIAKSFTGERFLNDRRNWYYDFFHIIKNNAQIFRLLLQAHMLNMPIFSTYAFFKKLNLAENTTDHYAFLAWQGALSTITIHWFDDGMKESIDYMADFCISALKFELHT